MHGNVILAIRSKHDLTQQSLADKIGVSRSLIDAIESGKLGISRKTRGKLSVHFTIDDETLLFLDNFKTIDRLLHNS